MTTTTSTTSTTTTTSTGSTPSSLEDEIIGGVIGGLASLIGFCVAVLQVTK